MKALIQQKLIQIEQEHNVRILYACESGSRAWDFASPDSDFDVRFIYVREPAWYLRLDKDLQRDVIALPIEGDLDINGWDLQKALGLMKKSNPTLLEWISSPIVYINERQQFKQLLKQLADQYLCPRACFYHYQHMAKGNYREHLQGELVKMKKYLYVLRPLLAMRWLEQKGTQVPMRFSELVAAMCDDKAVKSAIEKLLEKKTKAKESELSPKIDVLNNFIESELSDVQERAQLLPKSITDYDALNAFFLEWVSNSRLFDKAIVA